MLEQELETLLEESRKATEHLAKPIASIDVSKGGRAIEVFIDTQRDYYGDWIEGEGADICLHRERETERVVGARLPCYAKTLMIGGDNFPLITIDLESGKVSVDEK